MLRKVGIAAPPDAGPVNNWFAVWVLNVAANVPDVVTGEPETLKIEGIESPTLVTVPVAVDAIVAIPSSPVPVVVMVTPVPSTTLNDPPELESVTVWLVASDVLANVCSSFVVDPSTSVAVRVITFPASAVVRMPAAVIVTGVPPDVLELIIDVVPVPAPTVRSPSFVTSPSTSVPVIVKVG